MVKLSDALRGAADRAPLDGLAVDAGRARRRVSAQRGLRAGASGVLGAGMVAVFAVGVVGPGAGTVALDAPESGGAGGREGAMTSSAEDAAGSAAGSSLAWGMCGEPLPAMPEIAGPVTLATSLAADEVSGESVEATVTTVALGDGTFETFGLDGVILWDGLVVGTLGGSGDDAVAAEPTTLEFAAGEETTTSLTVPLVNCWDGAALPAGKYELVVTEELWAVATEPVEPVEPSATPTEESTGAGSAGSGIASGGGARVVAPAVGFAVAGDPVEDPFGAYLGAPVEPSPVDPQPPVAELPDGALNPLMARDMYLAGLTGAWDMAPGSQRWLVSSDSRGELGSAWYGCGFEGDGTFPAESSVMDLLGVEVDAPSAIDVSYGWIVEGNPELTARVTNTSEWDLTDFWGRDSVQLVLVRDGRVVAEGYPVDPDMGRGDMAAQAEADAAAMASGDAAMTSFPAPETRLAAGDSVGGTYLWRDVSGCWGESGQAEVTPGTYTLLAMHYLSVGGGMVIMEDVPQALPREDFTEPSPADGAFTDGSAGSLGDAPVDLGSGLDREASGSDAAILPAPESYDAVDFQVWTALGEIRVS
ncbi:hypothetical protein Lsed01_01960 [Demequina sediminis]|uniref:Uncharacterized protein n=1 Tax=Demequina sediminis TaxID=1930058 RepID=A0ABP9WL23_9MICO|nr:hypothetical protein [Demequina sediminis]BDZ62084.1 hypothetical protein GCM10025873_18750 [Demequina sediminis]